jgi:hypothetical protein
MSGTDWPPPLTVARVSTVEQNLAMQREDYALWI